MFRKIIGDACTEMQKFSNNEFDATVTSPPYNIGVNYGVFNDKMTPDAYDQFTQDWVSEALRISRVLIVNFGAPSSKIQNLGRFIVNLSKVGVIQSHISWVKSLSTEEFSKGHFKPVNSKRFLNNCHESIFVISRDGNAQLDRLAVGVPFQDKSNIGRFAANKQDRRCRGNVWFVPYQTRQMSKDHPATYPEELARMMILLSGARNNILDPFVGSGTTADAAESLGLDCTGIDLRNW